MRNVGYTSGKLYGTGVSGSGIYLGYNTIGGSGENPGSATWKWFAKRVTPPCSGLLTTVEAAVKGNASNVQTLAAGVFSDNAGAPLRQVALSGVCYPNSNSYYNAYMDTVTRWLAYPMNYFALAGVPIWLMVMVGNNCTIAYDAGGDYGGPANEYMGDAANVSYTNQSRSYSIRGLLVPA